MHDQFDFLFPMLPDNMGIARSWGSDENDLGVNELPTDRRHSSLHLNWHGTPASSAPLTCVNLNRPPQPVSSVAICSSPLGDATAFWSSALKCFSIYSITGCRPIFNFPPVRVVSLPWNECTFALCSTMSATIGSYNTEDVWACELCFEINEALSLDTSSCLFSAIVWTCILSSELFLTLHI